LKPPTSHPIIIPAKRAAFEQAAEGGGDPPEAKEAAFNVGG